MVSCAVFETIYNKIVKHENTVGDLSCFVTGVLIAFNIPVAAPLWLTVFGGLFGIVIVKMLFGGIGKNFMNPALGARAFMMASWAGFMTTWTAPHAKLPLFGNVTVTDAISTATPLASLKTGTLPDDRRRHRRDLRAGADRRRPVPALAQGHHHQYPGGVHPHRCSHHLPLPDGRPEPPAVDAVSGA